MFCPICYNKSKVLETRNNIEENEIYRRRICNNKECGHKFYTAEFIVEETDDFKESFNRKAIKGGR